MPAKDVEEWVGSGPASAERHGPRWYTDARFDSRGPGRRLRRIGRGHGKKIEAGLDAKTPTGIRLRLLEIAGPSRTRPARLRKSSCSTPRRHSRTPGYAEHLAAEKDIPIEKFAGRKSKSTRGVLVELFTGAQCPPASRPTSPSKL